MRRYLTIAYGFVALAAIVGGVGLDWLAASPEERGEIRRAIKALSSSP